jgi:hypothetical protein
MSEKTRRYSDVSSAGGHRRVGAWAETLRELTEIRVSCKDCYSTMKGSSRVIIELVNEACADDLRSQQGGTKLEMGIRCFSGRKMVGKQYSPRDRSLVSTGE